MYFWLEEKYIDKSDDIQLWESNLPHYIFPRTHNTPEFIRKCHACYLPSQRAIIAPTGEILFAITPQAIDQMIQAPTIENATPFSYEALVELYQKLDFSKRAKTLQIFLTKDAPLPTKNPSYPSSIFPKRAKKFITTISYLLGYYSD